MKNVRIPWQRLVAGLVLLCSVPWLLVGAVRFWTVYTVGVWPEAAQALRVASWHVAAPVVAVELVALWGWSQARWLRDGRGRVLAPNGWALGGLVASVLLVAGPLYVITDPVLRELAAPSGEVAETPQIAALRAKIASLEADAARFRQGGATGHLAATQGKLAQAHASLLARLDAQEAERARRAAALDWRRWTILALEVAFIVLLQTFAAVGYRVAFGSRAGRTPVNWQDVRRPGSVPAAGRAPDSRPQAVAAPADAARNGRRRAGRDDYRRFAHAHGLTSQEAVAERLGVARSKLSEYLSGRPVGPDTARKIEAGLLGGRR